MLIENLVIYAKTPYVDSKGRTIYRRDIDVRDYFKTLTDDWHEIIDFAENGVKYPTFKDIEITHICKKKKHTQIVFPIGVKKDCYM